jgi:hypothetical protein
LEVGTGTICGSGITTNWNQIGAIHFPSAVHVLERRVSVGQIVLVRQRHRRKRNYLTTGVQAAAGDVCPARDEHRILKKVIRRPILLKNYDDMRYRMISTSAPVETEKRLANKDERQNQQSWAGTRAHLGLNAKYLSFDAKIRLRDIGG